MNKIETRAVAAASYKNQNYTSCVTHGCEIEAGVGIVRVLCSRVKIDSMLDDSYAVDDVNALPTCPVCAKRFLKARAALK